MSTVHDTFYAVLCFHFSSWNCFNFQVKFLPHLLNSSHDVKVLYVCKKKKNQTIWLSVDKILMEQCSIRQSVWFSCGGISETLSQKSSFQALTVLPYLSIMPLALIQSALHGSWVLILFPSPCSGRAGICLICWSATSSHTPEVP